jgi:hypothetical protein
MQILQQQIDSAGNIAWALINTIDILAPADALVYLQSLAVDGNHYQAEIWDGNSATIVAWV